MEPQIRYVRSFDGTRLATATIGSGAPLLMMMPTGLGTIESLFAIPEWSRTAMTAAERFTFVTYDPRGQGLSDRIDDDLSLDTRVRDLEAVVDALELPPLNLLGRGLTGPAAIKYAVMHPDRVRRLALWAAPANGRSLRMPPRMRSIAPLMEVDWPLYCQVLALIDFGWGESARLAAEHLMHQISPQTLAKNWNASRDFDATDLLPQITCPTMAVYPKGIEDRVSMDSMRSIAALVPNAVFRTSETYSLYWGGGDIDAQVLIDFFAEGAESHTTETSGMTVILFTDIADSTGLTERMGDAPFRGKARDLDTALRAVVREHGGSLIDAKTLGDGILATFPSASQAVSAALACSRAGEDQGLPLHVGLHAGDVIREASNVFGGAVNVAARISALADPGEVLVSDVVRALARTSAGVAFEDRGERALKGISDAQRVFAVRRLE